MVNYLMLKIASAISNLPLRPIRSAIASVFGALVSLCAVSGGSFFVSPLVKLVVFALSTVPLISCRKDCFPSVIGTLCAALLTSGMLYAMCYWFGGSYSNHAMIGTVPIRAFVILLCAMTFLPRWIRKWFSSKRTEVHLVPLKVVFEEHVSVLSAYIDSGNFLKEPLSGKSVALIRKGKVASDVRFATLVPYSTVASGGILYAAKPTCAYIEYDGWHAIDIYVAEAAFGAVGFDAIISSDMLPHMQSRQ